MNSTMHKAGVIVAPDRRRTFFILNLVQDVNILRPLIYISARDLHLKTTLLVTPGFSKRDKSDIWKREIEEICSGSGATTLSLASPLDAFNAFDKTSGVLIAGSESNLAAHEDVHDLFRIAPNTLTKITLQHGLECVGFLQSQEQKLAHGDNVTFGADIVCGWAPASALTSLKPSQRSKLIVTGPTSILQSKPAQQIGNNRSMGIVCENMHSLRLRINGDFKADFLSIFGEFCQALGDRNRHITLRPHPGGQYVLKNNVELTTNVTLNNNPIYKIDLSQYAYGISAPSSILLDMVLAGIPTAVWQDEGSSLDLANYQGLTRISTLEDWLAFSEKATRDPKPFVELQRAFLTRHQLQLDALRTYQTFANLLSGRSIVARENHKASAPTLTTSPAVEIKHQERILFFANGIIPTLQLSFIKPLKPLVSENIIECDFITEDEVNKTLGKNASKDRVEKWTSERIDLFKPTVVVFCRFSAPCAIAIFAAVRQHNCPTIYHIDDDLLHIPKELGQKKFEFHNQRARTDSVRFLLNNVSLVYSSTAKLKARLQRLGITAPIVSGAIYCSGSVISTAENREVSKVGYMASADHAHNLEMILPAIIQLLERNTDVTFELFGSIPVPSALTRFGSRIGQAPKIDNYEEFLQRFSEYGWDIGICPLSPIDFNMMKANTKWVEYTSIGAAVVAQRGTVYDECCADDCGLLAETPEQWLVALESLVRDPEARHQQVVRAQQKLVTHYSVEKLREQVLTVIDSARTVSTQQNAGSSSRD
jgi:hypothetical protein